MGQHDYSSYTVGLICSSIKVLAAAQSMLDCNYDFEGPTRDANSYHFGAIGERNVAITWLPDEKGGHDSTCQVATNMRLTFGNLQVCLVLGIGSGFSNEGLDIQLGDVVVSKPTTNSIGLVMIRSHQTTLGPTSELLLSTVCRLRRTYKDKGHGLSRHLQEMLQKQYRMKRRYSRPTTGDANGESPVIHYGCVASGDHVLENTKARDVLVQINRGILGHETDARGAMNQFPGCVHVIIGVTNHGCLPDNPNWVCYSAAMAALYAKEFILFMGSGKEDGGNNYGWGDCCESYAAEEVIGLKKLVIRDGRNWNCEHVDELGRGPEENRNSEALGWVTVSDEDTNGTWELV